MTTIQIDYNDKNEIVSFSLKGHAGYSESGTDIVCAAISAVTDTVIIGLTEKLKINVNGEKSDGGYIKCSLPENIPSDLMNKAQLLLECMVEEFRSIEKQYKKYIKVSVR